MRNVTYAAAANRNDEYRVVGCPVLMSGAPCFVRDASTFASGVAYLRYGVTR